MKFSALATFVAGLFLVVTPMAQALTNASTPVTSTKPSCRRSTKAPATPTASPANSTSATPTALPTNSTSSPPTSGMLNFAAKYDGLYLDGAKFFIKGVNYFGMEGDMLVPHGLWGGAESTSLAKIAAIMKDKKFNAVRLTLAVDAVLENKEVKLSGMANEAELQQKFSGGKTLRYLDVLDHVVSVFAQNKILVLLNAHMLVAGKGISPLWYTSSSDANSLEDAWKVLATRYKDAWNVIGADLKNEPHGEATWGSGDKATDWRLASLQISSSIHQITSRWLIFVEGMDKSTEDDPSFPCFWGENLMDVKNAPLALTVPERLVYSPHVYGPDVSAMSYFKAGDYPSNMAAIWEKHFGYVHSNKYGAMVVGEWGGKYKSDADIKWQDAFAQYLKTKSLGFFYWSLNPNAGDTEGLLENDWVTPRADKMDTLLTDFAGTAVP